MSFLARFANLFKGGGSGNRMLTVYALSRRCDEPVAGQIDLFNELSRTEDEGDSTFYTRKVLHTSGEKRCFDQVEVELWFDRNKNISNHDVTGGRWLEEHEYAEELARFNAPPEEDGGESSPGDESHSDELSGEQSSGSPDKSAND